MVRWGALWPCWGPPPVLLCTHLGRHQGPQCPEGLGRGASGRVGGEGGPAALWEGGLPLLRAEAALSSGSPGFSWGLSEDSSFRGRSPMTRRVNFWRKVGCR